MKKKRSQGMCEGTGWATRVKEEAKKGESMDV